MTCLDEIINWKSYCFLRGIYACTQSSCLSKSTKALRHFISWVNHCALCVRALLNARPHHCAGKCDCPPVPHTVLFQPVLVWVGTYFLIMSQSLREQEERSVWTINWQFRYGSSSFFSPSKLSSCVRKNGSMQKRHFKGAGGWLHRAGLLDHRPSQGFLSQRCPRVEKQDGQPRCLTQKCSVLFYNLSTLLALGRTGIIQRRIV